MKKLLFILSFLITIHVFAQPSVSWNREFTNLGYSAAVSVIKLPDGDLLLGTAESRILRFDSLGNYKSVFFQISSAAQDCHFTRLHLNTDNTITCNYTGSGYTSKLIELNLNGNVLKNIDVNFGQTDIEDIIKNEDGGYTLSGAKNCGGLGGGWDARIGMLDNNSNLIWNKIHCLICGCTGSFCDYGDEILYQTQKLSSGQNWSVGYARKGGSFCYGPSNGWVVMTNTSGDLLWRDTVGGAGDDMLFSSVLVNGNLVGFGYKTQNTGNRDFFLVCYSATGTKLWEKSVGTSQDEFGQSIINTADGNLLCAGYQKNSAGKWQVLFYKLNVNGDVIWSKSVPHSSLNDIAGQEAWIGNNLVEVSRNQFVLSYTTGNWDANIAYCNLMKITDNSCIANITNNDTAICKGSSITLNATALASSSVTDINGNIYPTVNIGTQTWIQKNLNVSRYRNGDIIPQVTDATQWANLTTGAWCWYNNDSVNYSKYGKLYNWYAVNDSRGLAPEGWRVPSDGEWNKLVKYLDNSTDTTLIGYQNSSAGGLLKEAGISNWLSPNTSANNSSNFTALPGGQRGHAGAFGNIGQYGSWWTSTQNDVVTSYNRNLYNLSGDVIRYYFGSKMFGLSVRCLKNTPITYLWSNGATTPSITVTPTVTTKYYCTVSNGTTTCKDSVTVTVSTIATNIITADTVKVCGTSASITAIAGLSSYSWSNGATTQATTVTASGWYNCTATNGACTAKDSVYVSLFNPRINQNDTTICGGNAISLAVASASVSDIDGNVYPIVNIGTQSWSQRNLNVSRYKNGDIIPQVTNGSQWAAQTTGAWCWYNNDSARYGALYGKLYNWYAVNDPRGLAPEGWQMPYNSDWNNIIRVIENNSNYSIDTTCAPCGESCINGAKLKESGTLHWDAPNVNATNSFGFTALPAGSRTGSYLIGAFQEEGFRAGFWTRSINIYGGVERTLKGNDECIWRGGGDKAVGLSVRFMKNNLTPSSYLWSTGATTPSITVTPTATTSYIVTVSNGIQSCKDTVKVTVNTLPTNIITVDTVKVCGTSTSITAAAGFTSYSWSNGATTQATTVTASGWYRCTVTNTAGCTGRDSVYVSLFNPRINQNDSTICVGNAISLAVASASVSDIDGNVYPIVNIGTQSWSQRNLNVSRYKNGDIIPQVTDATQWANLTAGAWCWYNNDSVNYSKYGKLYNWYAVNDPRGLAPEGWKVPSMTDFGKLIKYLDINADTTGSYVSSNTAGGMLKESGTTHWLSPNTGANNSTMFTALGAGSRIQTGQFFYNGFYASLWSSSIQDNDKARDFQLYYQYESSIFDNHIKKNGQSIRLVKNTPITYLWSTGASTPSITVTPTATTSYIVTVSNGIQSCKDTVKISIQANPVVPAAIQKQFVPTSIVAVTNVSGLVSETYRIKKVANAVSYNWSLKRGTLASITHLNALGVNDTAVTVTFNPCFLRDTLCVQSVGVCSTSVAKTAILYANTTPANISGITTPGGNFAACIGTTKIFTAYPATPTTTQTTIGRYRWTLPATVSLVSANADSSSITVQINTGFVGGSISVRGVNACTGTLGTALSTPLQYLPPTPLGISASTGSYNACINNIITYTAMVPAPTTSQTVASVFRWTKPANTTITSASSDSSSITLRFNTGFTGGALSVRGQTICGTLGGTKSVVLTSTGCKPELVTRVGNNRTNNILDAQLYPNPSAGSFNLKITTTKTSPIIVKVMNMNGQLMKSFIAKANVVNNIGNELKPGVYMVSIMQDGEEKVIRAVKQ